MTRHKNPTLIKKSNITDLQRELYLLSLIKQKKPELLKTIPPLFKKNKKKTKRLKPLE